MKGFASGLPDFEDAFCALLWRWALKNVGTCFLQAPRSKKLSIRYVFHGAGAPHRNSDAQKAHCFQQAVTQAGHCSHRDQ
jgi:hypothetical protein